MTRDEVTRNLLELAFAAGDGREMAILGEGNVSGAIDAGRFLVKASGTSLRRPPPADNVTGTSATRSARIQIVAISLTLP